MYVLCAIQKPLIITGSSSGLINKPMSIVILGMNRVSFRLLRAMQKGLFKHRVDPVL